MYHENTRTKDKKNFPRLVQIDIKDKTRFTRIITIYIILGRENRFIYRQAEKLEEKIKISFQGKRKRQNNEVKTKLTTHHST